ncbi:MAG: VCBS repeat-containing protein [Planctomycetes bacterium]|nr:VCBS repeat-containing protein [Planctomycetota bacterium]
MLLSALAYRLPAQTQFESSPLLAPGLSSIFNKIIAGDLDGDGDADLFGATLATLPARPYLLLRNDGRGVFTDATSGNVPVTAFGNSFVAPGLVTIDMEGDGDLDLFIGSTSGVGHSLLFENDGSGRFADVSGNIPAAASHCLGAIAADFDGDGDTDLVSLHSTLLGGVSALLTNNGAGVFTASFPFSVFAANRPVAADIDADGDVDFAFGEVAAVRLYRNDGGMVFTDVTATQVPALPGQGAATPTFGDVDGDGDPDLFVARAQGPADLLLRNNAGTFTIYASLPSTGTMAAELTDIDGDGDLDLFRNGIAGNLTLALNDGTGVFTAANQRLPTVTTTLPALLAVDVDGDADRDLLVYQTLAPDPYLLRNRHRQVVCGDAVIGSLWSVEVWSTPGYATLDHPALLGIGLSRLPQPLSIPGLGGLWLDLGAPYLFSIGLVPASAGVHVDRFLIPALPALRGIELSVQSLVEHDRGQAHLTGFDVAVIR